MIVGITHDSNGRAIERLSVSTKVAIGLLPNGDRNHPTKLDHLVFLRKKKAGDCVVRGRMDPTHAAQWILLGCILCWPTTSCRSNCFPTAPEPCHSSHGNQAPGNRLRTCGSPTGSGFDPAKSLAVSPGAIKPLRFTAVAGRVYREQVPRWMTGMTGMTASKYIPFIKVG